MCNKEVKYNAEKNQSRMSYLIIPYRRE